MENMSEVHWCFYTGKNDRRKERQKKQTNKKNGGPEMTYELAGNIHINTTLGSRYNNGGKKQN